MCLCIFPILLGVAAFLLHNTLHQTHHTQQTKYNNTQLSRIRSFTGGFKLGYTPANDGPQKECRVHPGCNLSCSYPTLLVKHRPHGVYYRILYHDQMQHSMSVERHSSSTLYVWVILIILNGVYRIGCTSHNVPRHYINICIP